MSDTDHVPAKVSSEGVTGLTMMAPVVGFPLVFHAVSGAVVGGIGLAALSAFMSPFAGMIYLASRNIKPRLPAVPEDAAAASAVSVPVPVTRTEKAPAMV